MKTFNCKKCGTQLNTGQDECPVCGAIYYVLPVEPEDKPDPAEVLPGGNADISRGSTAEPDDSDVNVYVPGETSFASGRAASSQAAQNGIPTDQPGQRPPGQPNQGAPRGQGEDPWRSPDQRRQPPPRHPDDTQHIPRQYNDDRQPPPRQRPPAPQQPRQRQQFPPPQQGQRPPQGQQRRPQPPDEYGRPGRPRRGYDVEDEYYDYPPDDGNKRRNIFIVAGIAAFALLTIIICIMAGVFDFGKNKNEPVAMIDVVGMMRDEAAEKLDELEISYKFETKDSTEPKDTVIEQSVKKNRQLKKDEKVVLTISSGEEEDDDDDDDKEVTVPNLVGMTYDAARREIIDLGLIPSLEPSEFSTYPENQVVRQNPEHRTTVKSGDTVSLTLSKGTEPTPTPSEKPGHTISVISSKGGSVSPAGSVKVNSGESKTFTISADSGYEIKEVKIDGVDVGAVSSYTFSSVQGDHTIYAVFQLRPEPTPTPTPVPTPAPTPVPTPSPTPPPPDPETQAEVPAQ